MNSRNAFGRLEPLEAGGMDRRAAMNLIGSSVFIVSTTDAALADFELPAEMSAEEVKMISQLHTCAIFDGLTLLYCFSRQSA